MNHTYSCAKKEKSGFGFQWNFTQLSKGISCNSLRTLDWKGLIDIVIQPKAPTKWFMNNLISLPANHRLHLKSEPCSKGLCSSHLYFTSTVDCSLHFQHNVWTKIVEEILPSTGPSIIRAAQAMKYRPGPTNNESYLVCWTSCLCIYHLSGCTSCDSLNSLADTTCWRHIWAVSLLLSLW